MSMSIGIGDVLLSFKIITIYNFDQEHQHPLAIAGVPPPTQPAAMVSRESRIGVNGHQGGVPSQPLATSSSA